MIYDRIVEQARNPKFYTHMGVPDDLIGRYNMIVIHLTILFASANGLSESESAELRQQLFEQFMREMESMVRDLGIDAQHVQHEVKNIAGISSKQIMIYEHALANGGMSGLCAEIRADFLKTHEHSAVDAAALAGYMLKSIAKVKAASPVSILTGQIEFAA